MRYVHHSPEFSVAFWRRWAIQGDRRGPLLCVMILVIKFSSLIVLILEDLQGDVSFDHSVYHPSCSCLLSEGDKVLSSLIVVFSFFSHGEERDCERW